MKKDHKGTFIKIVWNSGKKDILLGVPWLPLYSLSEITLALSATSLMKLLFFTTPRIPVSDLIPGNLKNYIQFNQTLDRKDIIFIIPLIIIAASFSVPVSEVKSKPESRSSVPVLSGTGSSVFGKMIG